MVFASFNFVPRRDLRRFMTVRGSSIVDDHAASPHNVSLLSAGFEYRSDATADDEEEAPSVSKSRGLAYSWPTFNNNMTEAECGQESIDALRVPTFIVPGAQKAGTSAIYKLLNMHPHVVSSRKFEVRCTTTSARMRRVAESPPQYYQITDPFLLTLVSPFSNNRCISLTTNCPRWARKIQPQ